MPYIVAWVSTTSYNVLLIPLKGGARLAESVERVWLVRDATAVPLP